MIKFEDYKKSEELAELRKNPVIQDNMKTLEELIPADEVVLTPELSETIYKINHLIYLELLHEPTWERITTKARSIAKKKEFIVQGQLENMIKELELISKESLKNYKTKENEDVVDVVIDNRVEYWINSNVIEYVIQKLDNEEYTKIILELIKLSEENMSSNVMLHLSEHLEKITESIELIEES